MDDTPNKIQLYLHCKKCLQELPDNMSPQEYSSLEVGWTGKGLQVWCKRHECSVALIEVPEDDTISEDDAFDEDDDD